MIDSYNLLVLLKFKRKSINCVFIQNVVIHQPILKIVRQFF